MDLANNIYFQEWKTCREALNNFDKIIVDLRKFGFGLVTIVLSANGFLFTTDKLGVLAILAIYIANIVLIVGLFGIDRVHEVFIRSAVLRAMNLEMIILSDPASQSEKDSGMGLSWEISYWSEKLKTGTWGNYLYLLFCLAACVLAIGGIFDKTANDNWTEVVFILIAISILVIVVIYFFLEQKKAKYMNKLFKEKVNKRTGVFGYSDLE